MNIESMNAQIVAEFASRSTSTLVDDQIRSNFNEELYARVRKAKEYHGVVGVNNHVNKSIKSTWKPGMV